MTAALVQTSVNGGGAVTGGVTAPSAATVQWSGVNTSGWLTALWEIYDFPPGFATPAGWSLNGTTNVLFFNGITPPIFTLPATSASTYGKWLPRLTVNGGLSNGVADSTLIDTSAGVKMLSPLGVPGVGYLEDIQFSTSRAWKQDVDTSLRALETAIGAGGSFTAGGDLVGSSTVQRVASITGASGTAASVALGGVATFGLAFAAVVTAPSVSHAVVAGTGATAGVALSISAQAGQQQTGVNANTNGGNLNLSGGAAGTGGSGAAGVAGQVSLFTGATEQWRVTATAIVNVQSNPLQWGTAAVGSLGAIRFPNVSQTMISGFDGSTTYALMSFNTNGTLTIGATTGIANEPVVTNVCASSSVNLDIGSTTFLIASATGIQFGGPLQGYAAGVRPFHLAPASVPSAATTTLSAAQYACPVIYITGNTTGTITFPINGTWMVVNQGTGVQTLKVGTGAVTLTVAANKTQICQSDGANTMNAIGGNI